MANHLIHVCLFELDMFQNVIKLLSDRLSSNSAYVSYLAVLRAVSVADGDSLAQELEFCVCASAPSNNYFANRSKSTVGIELLAGLTAGAIMTGAELIHLHPTELSSNQQRQRSEPPSSLLSAALSQGEEDFTSCWSTLLPAKLRSMIR